jgi:hypothetical protein
MRELVAYSGPVVRILVVCCSETPRSIDSPLEMVYMLLRCFNKPVASSLCDLYKICSKPQSQDIRMDMGISGTDQGFFFFRSVQAQISELTA